MPSHVVRDGDCIASIAARFGLQPDDLWNHPGNAALRESRAHPGVLRAGDVVAIPDPAPGPGISPGGTHRFQARPVLVDLRLTLTDEQGRVAAGVPYRLVVGERVVEGTTAGDGSLTEQVPARAEAAELSLDPDGEHARTVMLQLGHLDPVAHVRGVKQRLRNLGYAIDETSEVETEAFRRALRAFQENQGLDPNGLVDEATRSSLREVHGS